MFDAQIMIASGAGIAGFSATLVAIEYRRRWLVLREILKAERAKNFELMGKLLEVSAERDHFQRREAQRLEHLRRVGAKGKITQQARAAEARAERATIEAASREKTIEELRSTKMRSRAQVVAPVKAARTRRNNQSGAGVAAKTGG